MKRMVLILVGVVLVVLMIKIYFEISNYVYQKKIEGMREDGKLSVGVEESVEHKVLGQDGYDVHYYVSGVENGSTVVFLHPAFSDHRVFDGQVDFFSKRHRVICIDMIGHGLSKRFKSGDKIDVSAGHIAEILEAEGVGDAHIVGVSVGSLVGQYFALRYPERVKSLVSVGGYDIDNKDDEVAKSQMFSNFKLIFRAAFSMKSFRQATAEVTAEMERGRALFYESSDLYERRSFMVMSGLENIIQDRDMERVYSTLILVGEFDIELSRRMAGEWHDGLEGSEYGLVEGAGHCVNLDRPNRFNDLVLEFIESND